MYHADALNVAVQDGAEAGQSVNHVHVHIIPRRRGDVEGDEIYDRMDGKEGNLGRVWEEFWSLQKRRGEREEMPEKEIQGGPDAEGKRVNRSEEEMRREAELLRSEMEKDNEENDDAATG